MGMYLVYQLLDNLCKKWILFHRHHFVNSFQNIVFFLGYQTMDRSPEGQ